MGLTLDEQNIAQGREDAFEAICVHLRHSFHSQPSFHSQYLRRSHRIAGIMPIMTFGGFTRMTTFCKTDVPPAVTFQTLCTPQVMFCTSLHTTPPHVCCIMCYPAGIMPIMTYDGFTRMTTFHTLQCLIQQFLQYCTTPAVLQAS